MPELVVKGRRVTWQRLLLGGCCGCCALVAGTIGIILWQLWPKSIEEYGICYINVCGHEPGGGRLRSYRQLDFSGAKYMSTECSEYLQQRLLAGDDLTLYVGVWVKNPNDAEASVATLSAEFSRAGSGDHLVSCRVEPFVVEPGDLFLKLQCQIPASARRAVEALVSDYTQCREVGILQEFNLEATVGDWSVGGFLFHGPSMTLNPGGKCAQGGGGGSMDWLGNDESCPGTTDVAVKSPSVYFCAVRGFSVLSLELELELDVFNPSVFEASITQLRVDIYPEGGGSVAATVERPAGEPLVVAGGSNTVFLVKGRLKSAWAAGQVALKQSVEVSGIFGMQLLGFNLRDVGIPRTTVPLFSDSGSSGGSSSWTEAISGVLDAGSQASSMLLGSAGGSCQCIFSCAAEEVALATREVCAVNTGGLCMVSSCDASREATCSYGRCLCKDDECAVDGRCVLRSATTPRPADACEEDTGGTCSVMSCDSSRRASCSSGRCLCQAGQCAVNGACVAAPR